MKKKQFRKMSGICAQYCTLKDSRVTALFLKFMPSYLNIRLVSDNFFCIYSIKKILKSLYKIRKISVQPVSFSIDNINDMTYWALKPLLTGKITGKITQTLFYGIN